MVIHGEGRERSAACNSLTEGEETGRARGDRGFHKGQKSARGRDRRTGREVERRREVCGESERGRRRHCGVLQRDDQSNILSIHPLMRDEDNLMHSFQARLTDEGATLKQPVQPKKSLFGV